MEASDSKAPACRDTTEQQRVGDDDERELPMGPDGWTKRDQTAAGGWYEGRCLAVCALPVTAPSSSGNVWEEERDVFAVLRHGPTLCFRGCRARRRGQGSGVMRPRLAVKPWMKVELPTGPISPLQKRPANGTGPSSSRTVRAS